MIVETLSSRAFAELKKKDFKIKLLTFEMTSVIRSIFVPISIFAFVTFVETVENRPRRLLQSSQSCGVAKISSGLIVHGQNFSRGRFPWIAALTYTKVHPPMFFCAGTIISSKFVLSGKNFSCWSSIEIISFLSRPLH